MTNNRMDFRYSKHFHLFVTDFTPDQPIHQHLSLLNMMIDIDILPVSFIVRCTGRSQRQESGSGLFALVSFSHFSSICFHWWAFHIFLQIICRNVLFSQLFSHLTDIQVFCILLFSFNRKGIIHQLCMYRSYLVFQIKLLCGKIVWSHRAGTF